MRNTIENVLENAKGLLYESTDMALELICEDLYFNHNIDAKYQGRSIYVGEERVASIQTCIEEKGIIAIWKYKILIK